MGKAFNYLLDKLGWGKMLFILIFVIVLAYIATRTIKKDVNSEYVRGVSLGVRNGSKGQIFLEYTFRIKDSTYRGNVTDSFCDECKDCCVKGSVVIVRYEDGNPQNNNLVVHIPKDAHLQ